MRDNYYVEVCMKYIQKANNQIISYQKLRILIGLIGFLLPVILIIGSIIQGGPENIEDSISSYYYTDFRDIFVGSLFVLGFFLLSYKGKSNVETWVTNTGFVFSLGIALFPCKAECKIICVLHCLSAVLLFAMFASFSLWLFRKDLFAKKTNKVLKRINVVYICTGIALIVGIIGLILFFVFCSIFNIKESDNSKIVLIFEVLGLFSFAYAWFTRAHFLWRDREEIESRWYFLKSDKSNNQA
jgi:hypothetical protein